MAKRMKKLQTVRKEHDLKTFGCKMKGLCIGMQWVKLYYN